MASTIKLKRGSGAPASGSLAAGEPALDLTNNKLYSSTDGTDIVEIGFTVSGISNVVEDTTPQLGGTLDANGNIIDMGVNTITDTKVGQWSTAYSWGNHASAGYLTSVPNFADGSVSSPSITFSADTNTGFYRLASGVINVTGDGVCCMSISQNTTAFTDNGALTSLSNGGIEILKNAVSGGIMTQSSATSDYNAALFRNSSGTQGSIVVSASATAYNTSSDYRLKENVAPIENAVGRIETLNPVRFNFISNPNKTVDGFLAHEVTTVVPEAVTGAKDAVDAEGNPVYQGIDQSKLVPLLVAAVQELSARVAALEAN